MIRRYTNLRFLYFTYYQLTLDIHIRLYLHDKDIKRREKFGILLHLKLFIGHVQADTTTENWPVKNAEADLGMFSMFGRTGDPTKRGRHKRTDNVG